MLPIKLITTKPEDTGLLISLYGSTRTKELANTGWSEEQKSQFIQMQFNAQHAHYSTHYSKAAFDIIYYNSKAVGRFYVCRNGDDIRVIDITLLPPYQGMGIGTQLLNELLEEAREQCKEVSLHCEIQNSAQKWYCKLGFHVEKEKEFHHFMKTNLHQEKLVTT